MGGSTGGGAEIGGFGRQAQKEALRGLQQLGGSAAVQQLGGQGLTGFEERQLAEIGAGRGRAEQTIAQNVREQAAARGLLSSASAIGQEAAGLAGLDVQEALQRQQLFGQAQQRQFQGLGLQQSLLGQQAQIGSGLQSQALQQAQLQNQFAQQQQAQQSKTLLGAGKMAAGVGSLFFDPTGTTAGAILGGGGLI